VVCVVGWGFAWFWCGLVVEWMVLVVWVLG
jgi:hypothetical protein